MAVRPDGLAGNPDNYRELADNLVEHGIYGLGNDVVRPTAYRPPLYPIVLAIAIIFGPATPIAIGLLHLTLHTLTVAFVVRLGRQWRLRDWSYVAAALVALDPILVHQATLVMNETLVTLLTVSALVCLSPGPRAMTSRRAAFAGALLAMASLCRPTFLPLLMFGALVFGLSAVSRTVSWRAFVTFVLAGSVVLTPWAARNYWQLGSPIVSTTNGGFTMYLGNNPRFYEFAKASPITDRWVPDESYYDQREIELIEQAATTRDPDIDERRLDRAYYRVAFRHILDNPTAAARAALVKLAWFWGVAPHSLGPTETHGGRALRYGSTVWYAAVFLFGLYPNFPTNEMR